MTSASDRWAEQARYDLETAQAMMESGRYLYVLFCCQQAVEKMLKALIATRTRELPPRLHHLMRLVEVAGIKVEENQADFLRELSAYYIQTRYPEEISDMGSEVKEGIAREILIKTKEVVIWLSSMR
jgi:HEPN domain-containing protein